MTLQLQLTLLVRGNVTTGSAPGHGFMLPDWSAPFLTVYPLALSSATPCLHGVPSM